MRVTLTISLIVLLATSLFTQSEYVLQYDSGEPDKSWTFNLDGWFFTTRFTPPEPVKLVKARFYIADTSNGATYDFSIYRAGDNEPAGALVFKEHLRASSIGWNEIDISRFDVQTDEDFYLSIEYDFQSELTIGADTAEPIAGRSYDSDC
mgnify:CR=1 FL=1